MPADSTPSDCPLRVMLVYGTRPEAIKLAPLVAAMRDDERFNPIVVVTGQHREMLDQVHEFFGIVPDEDLDIHAPGQTLTQITNRSLQGVGQAIEAYRPDAVVVQGDTTSAFAAALAAFYHEIPVLHVEAGLRTGNISSPFPEEANRRLISQVTALHLCPTTTSRDNLLRESTDPQTVRVTGNTVIDALLVAVDRRVPPPDENLMAALEDVSRRVVLVTAHRRESWGEPMRAIGRAVTRLAEQHPEVLFVLPIHRNPRVREALLPQIAGHSNIVWCDPLEYGAFCALIDRCDVVLTDSGGVQEEAPALSKPVLVMRDNTERPEAVAFGVAELVGTDEDRIVERVSTLLTDEAAYAAMAQAANPYGDGHACKRILAATAALFDRGVPLPEFNPVPISSLKESS
ncbi:non-hydrolyzing UDP-N-acetylglucosamine 2-epimerase [uncultured Actinomyces sp.]|uniref:non-hydrolyzing UDP-N-acetylglucosamine 2-epimerase n=1 Tax=uncultured Actinomyces sp. TaxID=249061 RepID=UPI0028D508F1|nr:UDP-N-acetylglucosamine 2-epimerase (non-hydrolyzing) [uncultured Actinomyces sp.]